VRAASTTAQLNIANYNADSCNYVLAALIDTAGKMTTACQTILESLGT